MSKTLAILFALVATPVLAQTIQPATEVAKRGGVVLTVADIDAKVRSMPADLQAEYLDDPDRMSRLIDTMLLTKQLALAAEQRGMHQSPDFAADMELQRTELLSRKQMQAYIAEVKVPDFERIARERYLANPESFQTKPRVDLSHILISVGGRDEEEAKELAEAALAEARGGREFTELVMEYSDEPGKATSGGLIQNADSAKLDPQFAAALASLDQPGDLVGPVRSRFGYHVVRLERYDAPVQLSFDSVKLKLINEIREGYLAQQRSRYLVSLSSQGFDLNGDAIRELPARYMHLRPANPQSDEPGPEAITSGDDAPQALDP
jgi:peptidyl-prolyl cis-trans isomerase C